MKKRITQVVAFAVAFAVAFSMTVYMFYLYEKHIELPIKTYYYNKQQQHNNPTERIYHGHSKKDRRFKDGSNAS